MKSMFENVYYGKKVLVTGHTGFKGAWLSTWLLEMGASVVGVSKEIPTNPSLYVELGLDDKLKSYFSDIRVLGEICEIINTERPDYVFHLAAQAIVSKSYSDPIETITTNVVGTANILESLRCLEKLCVGVIITSDKSYNNSEWVWGYREIDRLGGKDVYSGSKGAAELIISSYIKSFYSNDGNILIGICRAGNVIGGGDWAKDRIVVDCINAWSNGRPVEIRSPEATRPWQHVLEPLSGYLTLGMYLRKNRRLHGEPFNFGPKSIENYTVLRLLSDLSEYWDFKDLEAPYKIIGHTPFSEAGLLKLNCDKALFYLSWKANLSYSETIQFVGEWYNYFYNKEGDIFEFTKNQIHEYQVKARVNDIQWVN